MNLYIAIIQAADQIDAAPESYNFGNGTIPGSEHDTCGSPSCALGWIGSGLRLQGAKILNDHMDVARSMGMHHFHFYDRMDELDNSVTYAHSWRTEPKRCARALRLYAEKYHSDQKPSVLDPVLATMLKNMDNVLTDDWTA